VKLEFKWKGISATGGAAVLLIVWWQGTPQLIEWENRIQPNPSEWIAVDRTGAPITIRIGRDSLLSDSSLLADVEWGVTSTAGAIRVVAGADTLGALDSASLESAGLFNELKMPSGRTIRFTDELSVGMERYLFPPYPFWIRADGFRDEYNSYSILSQDRNTVLATGALITKNLKVFSFSGQVFMVFVARAAHNDPAREPWAVLQNWREA